MADTYTPTQFFKFIRPPFNLNLSIPKAFLPYLNGGRCSKATLRRGGHEWPVEITDGSFSGDGWRKCVTENEVEEFDIIVFEYQGNMVFDFLVFDPSGSEKEYPNPSGEESESESEDEAEEEEEDDDDDDEEEEENSQLGDNRCFTTKITPYYIKSSVLATVPLKFASSNGLIPEEIHTQVIIRDERGRKWPATLKNNNQIRISVCREFRVQNHLKIGDTCMFKLVKRGEVVVFDFSRKKRIKINYTRVKKPIKINYTRVKKETTRSTPDGCRYFTSTLKPCSITKSILHLPVDFVRSNGLINVEEVILRDDKSRLWEVSLKKVGSIKYYHGLGFRAFVVANKLKEGDAFKFELVENEKNKPPLVNFSCKFRMPMEEDDHQGPYFIGKLKSYGLGNSSYLYLPNPFAKKNGLFYDGEMILINGKDERSWFVELKNYMTRYCYIGRGWNGFCVANGLKEGDHYKFEIVDKIGESICQIHLQRKMDYSMTDREMILINGKDERSWVIELKNYMTRYCYIEQGWKGFCVANGLKEGDCYKFEIGEKLVVKFYVLCKSMKAFLMSKSWFYNMF